MALKRMKIDGYGQMEINNCAFRRDGRVEAQCFPDASDFSNVPVENGMLLAVDNAKRTLKFATDDSLPIAIVYSAEHLYDERALGLKNFKLDGSNDFLPRLGYLSRGDKYTTNCISYDAAVDTAWASDADVKNAMKAACGPTATTTVYGGIASDGSHLVSATKPTVGPVLKAVKYYTMPDGSWGVRFQCMEG